MARIVLDATARPSKRAGEQRVRSRFVARAGDAVGNAMTTLQSTRADGC
jgi:hypothetical protein